MKALLCSLGFDHKWEVLDSYKGVLDNSVSGTITRKRCTRCGKEEWEHDLSVDISITWLTVRSNFMKALVNKCRKNKQT